MINAEPHRSGREIRQIRQDRDENVPASSPKNEVMRRIVDDDVVGVIGEGAHEVGD